MTTRHDDPEFSNIRSPIDRAAAQRSFAAGVMIAETLLLAGDMLRRAAAAMLSIFRSPAKRSPSRRFQEREA